MYPLAATVAAESSTDNSKRGMEVSAVFSTQVGRIVLLYLPKSDES